MRKLLLASSAVLGAGLWSPVSAQTVATTTGTPLPPTWTEGPQPTAPSGIGAGNNNLTAQGFYTPGPMTAPAPGSIIVHFNGRVVWYAYAENQNADNFGGRKAQPYGTLGYFRFYPGVDAMAANGLRYGAGVEIREQTSTSNASTTSGGSSAANFGTQNINYTGTGALNTQPGNNLYVRRAFAYIGGPWGAIHVGSDDGPLGLLDAGVTTFQTYNDGGWNDDLNAPYQGPNIPVFPFPSAIGNEYTTSKVVYLSPQIAGFDFAASFEPDDNPLGDNVAGASASGASISTGLLPGEIARRRNTYEVGLRYQGAFGPAGVYAFGGYIGSGHVNPGPGATAPVTRFDNMGAWNGGAAVTVAGFRVGGSVFVGQVNNQLALKPDGGHNMIAYLGGTQYTVGPLTVGASYMNILSAGALSATGGPLASQRREGGINVGGTYVIAPGLLGWLSASYGERYQGGFNFNSGTLNTATSEGAGNHVHFEAIAIGGAVKW